MADQFAVIVDKASAFLDKVKSGDRSSVAIAAASSVVVAYGLFSLLTRQGDGKKYMSAEQLALADGATVNVAGQKIVVERVTSKDVASSALAIAKGNRTNPLIVACAAEDITDDAREKASQWLYSVLLRSTAPSSSGAICLKSADSTAAAVWFPKGANLDYWPMVLNGGWQYLWKFSGWGRRGRFPGYGEVIQARRQRLLAESAANKGYYYLLTAGAAAGSDAQLQAVVVAVTQQADARKLLCYAEVAEPRLKRALEATGFKLVEPFALFGVTTYIMMREPQA